MEGEKDLRKDFFTRRDFLKISGLSIGAVVLGEGSNLRLSFAKDVYPVEKITCIVAHKPGGGYDLISRGIAPYLGKCLREISPGAKGGDVVIKNEGGASGHKAYKLLYDAKPDGYTFGTFEPDFAVETLTTQLDFDLTKYTYLLKFNTATRLLVTGKNGFKNWDEMLQYAKTKELKWGVGQFGRAKHCDSLVIRETLGIPARFIAWGSTAEGLNAILRGDVPVGLFSDDAIQSLLDAGELRVLADFTGGGGYPGIPTSKDLGHPELAEKVGGHRFYIAPPNLPKEIGDILVRAFKKTLNDPEFLAWTKKSKIPVEPIYGDEADKLAKRLLKYYQVELKPLVLKYLQ